ncbi:hypothetical protein Trydic_g3722 [Trypoxylus dichotomus]
MSVVVESKLDVKENPVNAPKKEESPISKLCKGPRMTKEFILKHCKEQKLYATPSLNDVLYLHFKGFSRIENLDEYTGLRCLWLENNGIGQISGLDNQKLLRSLFLHYNLIRKIENLENCVMLDTLNLSHNQVRKIENLDCIQTLHTLNLANNYLETLEDVEHLESLSELSVLDISNNHIDEPLIVKVLGAMPNLRVLNLMGNPVIRKVPSYRKTMILACKDLRYLDDRPVFPRDRACAEAWERGGITEENAERQRWIERERQRIMDSVNALVAMRDARREAAHQQASDSGMGTSVNDSESEAESLSEPPRLRGLYYEGMENEIPYEPSNPANPPSSTASLSNINAIPNDENNLEVESEEEDDLKEIPYNYGNASEDEVVDSEGEDSTPSSSDSNDFMKDRLPEEDYEDYREKIFDFEQKKRKERSKKPLVQEIDPNEPAEDQKEPSNEENVEEPEEMLIKEVEVRKIDNNKETKTLIEEITSEEYQEREDPDNDGHLSSDDEIEKSDLARVITSYLKSCETNQENEDNIKISVEGNESTLNTSGYSAELEDISVIQVEILNEDNSDIRAKDNIEITTSTSEDKPLNVNPIKRYVIIEPQDIKEDLEATKSLTQNSTEDVSAEISSDQATTSFTNTVLDGKDLITSITQEIHKKKPEDDCETLVQIYGTDLSDSSSSSESEDEDEQYYQALDNAREIECVPVEYTEEPQEVVAKESITLEDEPDAINNRNVFMNMNKDLSDIKELLNWHLKKKIENKIILQPIRKPKPEDDDYFTIEGYEMLLNTNEKTKLEEPDRLIKSSSDEAHQYVRMLDFRVSPADIEPPKITNVLKMSPSYSFFEKRGDTIINCKGCNTSEDLVYATQDNSVIASNGISSIREGMRSFSLELDEIKSKYDSKYDELMRTYNEYWDQYVKKQDEETGKKENDAGDESDDDSEDDYEDLNGETSEIEKVDEGNEKLSLGVGVNDIGIEKITYPSGYRKEIEEMHRNDCNDISIEEDSHEIDGVASISLSVVQEIDNVCEDDYGEANHQVNEENLEEATGENEEHISKESADKEEIVFVDINNKNNDTELKVEEEELPVIKRDITCTLEMQLASGEDI